MDYGASTGRGIVGEFDGEQIRLSEVHRFGNDPVFLHGSMHWDTLRLLHGMKKTINLCEREGGIESLAIDTWGVDFGLLDEEDNLIGSPYHYRDGRVAGMFKEAEKYMSLDEIYEITGTEFMEINTLYQLLAARIKTPKMFERAKTMLMTPDLLGYFLTGVKTAEFSIASTTQMLDAKERKWSEKIINAFGFNPDLFQKITPAGTVVGPLTKLVREELEIKSTCNLVTGCGHDTQDAMLAVPASEDDFIFISCGTWALFGTELDAPVINEHSRKCNLSNEGGYDYKTSFIKNIIGTWLIQESRNQWRREGSDYSFGQLEQLANENEAFLSFVDPQATEFSPAGNMPKRIREFCEKTGQKIPETPGAIIRCINESLAMIYREALSDIESCTGKKYKKIYLVGGGSQSALLCQMTANATGCVVSAGPIEATVLGNLATQLIASGEVKSRKEAREIISRSPDIKVYEPKDMAEWDSAFMRYEKIIRR